MKTTNLHTLNKQQLNTLAQGCCFFASGGGGSLTSGLNLLKEYPEDGITTIVTKEKAIADTEAYTLVIAYIGAPNAIEDLGTPAAAIKAYHQMNEITGGKIKYLVPVEQGSLSTIVSCVAATEIEKATGNRIAVIDGDGAGRAVPELTMLTYASTVPMANQKAANGEIIPAAILASADGQKAELLVKSASAVEAIARPFISSDIPGFDQAAGLAIWLMNNNELETALPITGTIALSFELGTFLETLTPQLSSQNFMAVQNFLTNKSLNANCKYIGVMTKPEETTGGGFDSDKIVIAGIEDYKGTEMHIYALNENLIAWRTDKNHPIIIAPDSICYMNKNGQAFSNADITNPELNILNEIVGVYAIESRNELVDDTVLKNF